MTFKLPLPSRGQLRVLRLLCEAKEPLSTRQVSEALGLSDVGARDPLVRLVEDGCVVPHKPHGYGPTPKGLAVRRALVLFDEA